MTTIKTHGNKDLWTLRMEKGKSGELEVAHEPHLAGHDCPLCKKTTELFFNLSGAMGKAGEGAWAYFGCKRCNLVVYNPDYLFADFSPTKDEIKTVINPMVKRWNKIASQPFRVSLGNGRWSKEMKPVPPVPKVGTIIRHSIFGIGQVRLWEPKRGMIRIDFKVHGLKELSWTIAASRIKRVRVVQRTSRVSRARRPDKSGRRKR